MQKEKVWRNIIQELSRELDPKSLASWFSELRLKSMEKDEFVVETPNSFISDWIKKNYREQLDRAAKGAVGKPVKFVFEIGEPGPAAPARDAGAHAPAKSVKEKPAAPVPPPHLGLNPKYIFDNFVVGRSNQFAHAASMAVAEKKASNYNPLFIYGGVGLGKTHLLNAIGNEMYRRNPKLHIICLQAESFMNEMIQAIRQEKMDLFRKRFRKECDLLLMDDIQIIAGKDRTQEEFFYTFNDLYSAGRKIAFTSDKFPKEMTTLEERLRSRFESGIIVDIQPPEFETRLAILKYNAEKEGILLPGEIAVFLAERIKSNIRKLEGALIRLSAIASLSGSPITIELAEEVLHAILDDHGSGLSSDKVMKVVAAYFKIKVSDLTSPKRNRKYVVPRQIAMCLCREHCKISFPEIGQAFGGRDHSTVIHSCRKIGIDRNTDFELRRHLEALKRQLNQNG
ncbi:MAG TPA: chromosomal replication initiator protein DnaA [bacterium]|nr:chromosomal replication initiator protein DnaA [bacterium]